MKLTIKDVAMLGMMIAALEAAKTSLAFIPNVELVTLFIILFTRKVGKKAYFVVTAFVGIECVVWGSGLWIIMYLYIWPLLVLLTRISRNQKSVWFFSTLSGMFGLFFGALCSIPYLFIGGVSMAFTWWVSGIPFDIIHSVSNFLLCSVLFIPIQKVLDKFL